jgi:hypothetical protein
MSSPLRIAIVCEGPTDKIILDELIEAVVGHPNFRSVLVQPLMSALVSDFGPYGGGWAGVLRWCTQAVADGIPFEESKTAINNDLIIVHVDADVARETSLAHVSLVGPCPPAQGTCDNIRHHIRVLLGGRELPNYLVLCIPADSTEAWVVAALNPSLAASNSPWECYQKPEDQLPSVKVRGKAVGKSQKSYKRVSSDVAAGWPSAKLHWPEANRFEADLRAALRI